MVLGEIHAGLTRSRRIERIHADRSGPDGRRGVDVQGEIRHLDPSRSSRPALYTLDVDVCRRALRKHFVDTVDLYIDGTPGWSAAEADTGTDVLCLRAFRCRTLRHAHLVESQH